MSDAKMEAIANADAHTNNVGLPTYSELQQALIKADVVITISLRRLTLEERSRFLDDYKNQNHGDADVAVAEVKATLARTV